jgi:hypothetical protein
MATVQIPIRGVCGVCKQYVYANQDREKDPATGVYKHRNPHDCKVMATVQQPASTTHLADVGGPSAGAGRAKRWGDGLEAPAAGTRHFVPPGFAVKMAPKFFMPQGKETHIFLSHNRGKLADGRDNHAIVVAVAKRLEALGFVVWLDDIDMKVCHLEKERERERERDGQRPDACVYVRARDECDVCVYMYICILYVYYM